MSHRDGFIKSLHQSDNYKKAIAAARNDAERKLIEQVATSLVVSFADILGPMIDRVEQDPTYAKELAQKLERSLAEQRSVVTTSVPATSGSAG